MSVPHEEHLSRRERQIMDVVYARGAASAAEVARLLPDPPSKTAVRTLLRILEEKGHLTHEQQGIKYVYRPSRPRGAAGKSALRRVLDTFFEGSMEHALAAHLTDVSSDLKPDELKRLAALINKTRKSGTES
jgi:BlaI family penicillinase repressor